MTDHQNLHRAADVATATREARQRATPDPLEAFPTEAQVAASRARRQPPRRRSFSIGLFAAVGGVIGVAVIAWFFFPAISGALARLVRPNVTPRAGTLVVETPQPGWEITEAGRRLGVTPLTVSLPPGRHALQLRKGDSVRPLDVVLRAGVQVVYHLDLQAAAATGVLRVSTAPPGAAVTVDAVRRGVAPVDVAGLDPGAHSVTVAVGNRVVTQQITVTAGTTTTLLVPVGWPEPPPGTAGFVTVSAPIELQVFEGDALVGSSRNQRILLMSGRHPLRLVNSALGFERTVAVNIEAGAVAHLAVPVPNGSLSVNALPWAEVVLDGRVIGETPIANLAVGLGSHELVLRNPRFSEQRRTVVVSLLSPARVGVDMRQ